MALPQLLDAVTALPAYRELLARLPALGDTVTVGGLPGSSDATLSAALGRELGSTRFQVILAEALPEAERWLADLDALAVRLGTRATNVFTDSTALEGSVLTAAPQRPLLAPLLALAALILLAETLITAPARRSAA